MFVTYSCYNQNSLYNSTNIQCLEASMAGFQKGKSGNPAGKPKGARNKRPILAKLFEPHAEALIAKTIELALSGDPASLRLCIERLVPKVTDKSATVVMPDFSSTETEKIIPELLRSLAGQELSVSEIKSLLDIFNRHDSEIETKNKQNEKLEINTNDPIEAARIYQQIMRGNSN